MLKVWNYYPWILKERFSIITGISLMNIFLYIKEYGGGMNTYNNEVYINGSTFNEFEFDYYGKLEDVI